MSCIKNVFLSGCIILSVVAWGEVSQAHPHLFLDCEFTLEFDNEGLTGIWQRWILDEMFSIFLLEDFDTDQDMRFSDEEIETLKQGAFDNLEEFGYFTYIRLDEAHMPVKKIESFSAEVDKEGRVIYQFFVPCAMKAEHQIHRALIAVFDDTYYTDIMLVQDAITVHHPEHIVIRRQTRELPELRYYYDEIIPEGLVFAFQKTP